MKKSLISIAVLSLSLLTSLAYAGGDKTWPGGGLFNSAAGNCKTIGYSHYVGWEPYAYLASNEIMGKRAKEAGVCLKIEMIPDYITSLEAFTNGTLAGVTVTNMDLLSFQSSTGQTEVIIAGDYSNGNDAILVRSSTEVGMKALKGKDIGIVELSVNDYLLDRCTSKAGMKRSDYKTINFTSEGDIAAQFGAQSGNKFAATVWNPVLMNLRSAVSDAQIVCDSSEIPGEIIDVLAVDQNLSSKHKQALANAWYDTMAIMKSKGKTGKHARGVMALNAENSVAEYERQLKTTAMWYTPEEAAAFLEGKKLVETTKSVYSFTRKSGIVGDPQSINVNGNSVVKEAGNATIHYTSEYTKAAANR